MNNIHGKICNTEILDSEIIQDIEYAKQEDPRFDINECDEDNWPLLMYAVWRNREELVRYLLRVPDINVNHRGGYNIAQV